MYCPTCGMQVPDDSAYCPGCGADLSAARQVAGQTPVPTQPLLPAQPTAPFPQSPQPAQGYQAPPQPAQGYQQPMPPAGPGVPGAYSAPKKSNAGLIVGLSVLGVLLLVGFVGAGVFAFRAFTASRPVVSAVSTTPRTQTSVAPSASTTKGASTPDAAVEAWFTAIAKGDIAAVKAAATAEFAAVVEPSMFEGRDPNTSYRVISTQTTGDTATVDVQESPSNAPAQTATTITLAKQSDGRWLVSGYAITATGQTVGAAPPAAPTPPAAPVAPPAPVFTKTDAIDVVGTMLSGLNGKGSLSAAKAAATSRFKNANPGWIMRTSDFDFYVTGATKKGDAWVVKTKEQWVSGDETGQYTVIVKNGKGYVDRRNGLE